MPILFDSTGLDPVDHDTWLDPRTGDALILSRSAMIPDLPPFLHDPPRMLRQLAIDTVPSGVLVEANVVQVDGVPALYQIVKAPLPNRPAGVGYLASLTVPRAHCSIVLCMQAKEGDWTGMRETAVFGEVGPERMRLPHPYAPDLPSVWVDASDAPHWDHRFPGHPLTRVREWARRTLPYVRLDPRIALLPPFPPRPGVAVPQPPDLPTPTGQLGGGPVNVLPGVPLGDLICLSHDDGGSSFWQMADPAVALSRLALGELDRIDPTGRGAREVAVLNASARTLHLGDDATGVAPVDPDDALGRFDNDGIRKGFGLIADRAIQATRRGEALTVGLGGWHAPATPHLRLIPRLTGNEWRVYLQATPIPVFSPEWRDHDVVGDSQVFSGTGLDDTMPDALRLALRATETWGAHQLQLALSFTQHPDSSAA